MKIVIIVQHLTNGGAERVAALWANGFVQKGHWVTVVISHDQMPVTYPLPAYVKLQSVDPHKKNRVLRVLVRMWKFRKLLQKEKPQVVIDVMPSFDRIIARLGLGCCNISTEHNSFERPENAKVKVRKLKKIWLNRLYDHVTVLTQADLDVIDHQLKHVTVMPNPLALEIATLVPPKERIVLAVGRKNVWHCKGFDNLIRAWALMSAETAGWRLQIVGDSSGTGQEYLMRLCQEYGVTDTVEFPDYQSDIKPFYERAAIFVLSSRHEGFGLALIEAMSQGCACVACDYKGRQSEIVTNGVDGVTCEPDDVEALAAKIKAVMVDDELRSLLQMNAIRRAADFSVQKIADRWEEIFKTMSIPVNRTVVEQQCC